MPPPHLLLQCNVHIRFHRTWASGSKKPMRRAIQTRLLTFVQYNRHNACAPKCRALKNKTPSVVSFLPCSSLIISFFPSCSLQTCHNAFRSSVARSPCSSAGTRSGMDSEVTMEPSSSSRRGSRRLGRMSPIGPRVPYVVPRSVCELSQDHDLWSDHKADHFREVFLYLASLCSRVIGSVTFLKGS